MSGGESDSGVPPDLAAALFAGARDSGSLSSAGRPELRDDRYELVERTGSDLLGARWLAVEHATGAKVVVQVLGVPSTRADGEALDALLRRLAGAAEEGAVACTGRVDVDVDGAPRLALVSPLERGLRLIEPSCPAPTPRSTVEGCARVARSTHALHESGLVHGALSPGTIASVGPGEWSLVALGVPAALLQCGADGRRCLLREPEFLAPEVLAGSEPGAAADVFGLGATLYWGLAGRRVHALADERSHAEDLEDAALPTLGELPTLAAAVAALRPSLAELAHLDEELEAICLRALAPDPVARMGSALELAEALERYLEARELETGASLVVQVDGVTRTLPLRGTNLTAGHPPDADLPLPGASALAFELIDTGFGWCALPRERPLLIAEARHGSPVFLRHLSAFECGGASCTFVRGGDGAGHDGAGHDAAETGRARRFRRG